MFVLFWVVDPGCKAGVKLLHSYLANFDVDFVGAGIAFDANWHVLIPFFVIYFFTTARSLALRARGLKTNSV
jgi:hypothetical protein